eukprot:GHVN01037702.1.p1 GENE.GHVN01037702.1~~GHVN01037702.1.p1  ORF type:complete len:827 (+),score=112.59 GHVN01037702.1:178-2658(+)
MSSQEGVNSLDVAAVPTPAVATSAAATSAVEDTFMRSRNETINFFPANDESFVERAGKVTSITSADLADEHRARHLTSFKRSMEEWAEYEHFQKDSVDEAHLESFVLELMESKPTAMKQYNKMIGELRKKYHISPSKSQVIQCYHRLIEDGQFDRVPFIESFLIKKAVRTNSGVVVITVLTSPGQFSCPKDCHYCPNEPGQPRSYLSTEPAVLRANQNGWSAVRQFNDRATTLRRNGHTIDKVEILVLGGTWSGYPRDYQEEFIRDLFYAANTFNQDGESTPSEPTGTPDDPAAGTGAETYTGTATIRGDSVRSVKSLEEEQMENETAGCRIIGLTLETRPDHITKQELQRLRRFGCTRVQIGIQHTDDMVLKHINRGHERRHAVKAIQLLKDAAFKVDIHLMPDLPGSTPEMDLKMFEDVLSSKDLQADQWKIYPCEVTPFSKIEEWFRDGLYKPYAEDHDGRELVEVILQVKGAVHPWIRLNRVVRDIPNQSIIAGNNKTNLRQILLDKMASRKLCCRCIRCREVRDSGKDAKCSVFVVREYETLGGEELFLSFESEDRSTIFGFLRLRLRSSTEATSPFPELTGAALLRELHVYGQLVGTSEERRDLDTRTQHSGLGRRLILAAEHISYERGYRKMAVIAGIGTRTYYSRFGYVTEGTYMTKMLSPILPTQQTAGTAYPIDMVTHVGSNSPARANLDWIKNLEIEKLDCKTVLDRTGVLIAKTGAEVDVGVDSMGEKKRRKGKDRHRDNKPRGTVNEVGVRGEKVPDDSTEGERLSLSLRYGILYRYMDIFYSEGNLTFTGAVTLVTTLSLLWAWALTKRRVK